MPLDNIKALYEQLKPLGFLSHLDEEQMDWLMKVAEIDGIWAHDATLRGYGAGGEWMAEGGICDFLALVEPYLRSQRVPRVECRQEFRDEDRAYLVTVNGRRYTIYTEQDFGEVWLWAQASVRTFQIIEDLLREAGSPERIYALKGDIGYGGSCVFLTPKMAEVVNSSPYVPNDQKLFTVEKAARWIVDLED